MNEFLALLVLAVTAVVALGFTAALGSVLGNRPLTPPRSHPLDRASTPPTTWLDR